MSAPTSKRLLLALGLTAPLLLTSFAVMLAPATIAPMTSTSQSTALLPNAVPFFHVLPSKGGSGGKGGGGSGGSSCPTTLPSANGAAYTPSQIQTAYNYNTNTNAKGAGETIAIIDAYGDGSITTDLACFDQVFSLPAPSLSVVTPWGSHGSNTGWAMETALDVEWAHAMAPAASILLIVTPSASLTYLINDAVPYAVSHGANVISMSWGSAESSLGCSTETSESAYFKSAMNSNVILTAASGDNGANDGTSAPTVDYPSADPSVVGVGGTILTTTSAYQYSSEVVWNDQSGATGGGVSTCFSAPSYQTTAKIQVSTTPGTLYTPSGRADPDVSYDASPYTGFWVMVKGAWNQVGGTSDAAPQWAAIFADARSAGDSTLTGSTVHSLLYGMASSATHDITSGNNNYFQATTGYDACTGIGTPDETAVIAAL